MSDSSYSVVLTGELKSESDKTAALEAFAKLFKIDTAKAEAMLSKAPVVVKKDIDKPTAQKFIAAIEKVGFICELSGGPPLSPHRCPWKMIL